MHGLVILSNVVFEVRQIPVLAVTAFVLLYAGVVLPAVWSTRPARRAAAAAVLQQIIDLLRRSR